MLFVKLLLIALIAERDVFLVSDVDLGAAGLEFPVQEQGIDRSLVSAAADMLDLLYGVGQFQEPLRSREKAKHEVGLKTVAIYVRMKGEFAKLLDLLGRAELGFVYYDYPTVDGAFPEGRFGRIEDRPYIVRWGKWDAGGRKSRPAFDHETSGI